MSKSRSYYIAQMQEAWLAAIETARKRPLTEKAVEALRRHSVRDLHDTIDALMGEPPGIKSNGKPRTWRDDEPVWASWARWYPQWIASEIERVLPEIVANCALDREAQRREASREGMARLSRIATAEKIVDQLATGAKTEAQLVAALYPPRAHKARRAFRRVLDMLDGLGVVGAQTCRDGFMRWALWRSLWPEDKDALAAR